MPELLLELFSEEIPARFQRAAAEQLRARVTDALVERGLTYEGARAFVTPRRLALTVAGLPGRSPDTIEERKGPRVGAPDRALEGFVRSAGLNSIEQARVVADPKGDFYLAVSEKRGADTGAILAEVIPAVVKSFAWPKSMRWGAGALDWVRPLRSVSATFGTENDEPEVIEFEIDGLKSGAVTYGHPFLAPGPIAVKRFSDYERALEKAHVVLDLDRRRQIIAGEAGQLAFAQGLTLIEDDGLTEEIAGLVEWPVPLMGAFEENFLSLPEEVIVTTIRTNQKCYCLRDGANGRLANRFVMVADIVAADGGRTIVAGNERVIRARLSDAEFFYRTDLAKRLEDRLDRLETVVFHEKLGSQRRRIDRLVALSAEIAPLVGADIDDAKRAALLAKADLTTGMVGELPELQGVIGRYYAGAQGEPASVSSAIEMHYKPAGPSDPVPTDPVAIAVALADRLDLLTGFWAIEEKPTGSKDPYALRRAALGVIRIVTENQLDLPLRELLGKANLLVEEIELGISGGGGEDVVVPSLLAFFHDRLKVSLRERGARHDLVDAVIGPASDDMLEITRRVGALAGFLDTDDGANLLAGYRRAANILRDEEKNDGRSYAGEFDAGRLTAPEAEALGTAVTFAYEAVCAAVTENDFDEALGELAALRAPVDVFFEKVLVNDPDPVVRENRLRLLARLRECMHRVADFSRVEG